jgi:predicted ATPase/class 3 adenylate cyclase
MPVDLPSGEVTLAFTDIEGSSELSERYQAAFEPVREEHFRLLREAAARWNGIEVGTAGDSLVLVFAEPSDAVRWAVEAQRALLQHAWPLLPSPPPHPPLEKGGPGGVRASGVRVEPRVRIGLHTGEPFVSRRPDGAPDCFGPAVNRAARVEEAAHGGQILLSEATRAPALPALPPEIAFHNHGTHRLRGVGEEHLWQALHPGLPRDFPPLRTLNPERHNLPLPPTPFIGREAEIAAWHERLLRPATRLLTLTGFGGMGKTRAALHLAELCAGEFADGVWWIALEEARTAGDVIRRIVRQMRVPVQPHPATEVQLANYLSDRRLLLVLDNVEQVAGAADAIRDLLQAAPGVTCLVTTRRALDLQAEHVVELRPLPASDAERLFLDRARARQVGFDLTDENAADVAELCRHLDGIPLAIELAASRIVGMTPREILHRLNERFRLLQTRAPDLPTRQRALRAAIDWSYDLLAEEDRSLFAQLAVFAGGFTMEDAEAVCEESDIFEGVMELRRHSFLRAETDPETQQTRFLMLESLRAYAGERLREAPNMEQQVRRRHAEHFLAYFRERLDRLRTPEEVAALRQMEANADNLRAALEWAQKEALPELRARLALTLFVAGAPTQVVSQWSVDDASTATLMERFYGGIKRGEAKGSALRAAALSLRKDGKHAHPYYWAPFILVGDWRK